jgi:hypothetical protein
MNAVSPGKRRFLNNRPVPGISIWEDMVYNLTRAVKTLRRPATDGQRRWLPQSPAMKAGLTDHLWSIRELLTRIPVSTNSV